MSTYTKKELNEINDQMHRWMLLEHDGWLLNSFGKKSARFGLNVRGEYVKYVTIDANIIDFLQGVDPDVKDMAYDYLV